MRFQILILGFKGSIRTLRMPSKMSVSIMSKVGGGGGGVWGLVTSGGLDR